METAEDKEVELKYLKRSASLVLKKRISLIKEMSPSEKENLYYRVYQRLDRESIQNRRPNFLPPGKDKVIFSSVPLKIKIVGSPMERDITLGELLHRIHLACEEEMPETVERFRRNQKSQ